MSEPAGFHYTVSDEQLAVFRSLSPARRLAWLEEAREVTWRMAPEKGRPLAALGARGLPDR